MSKYIALRPILYAGRQHKPGEVIDCDDHALARIWIDNGAVRGSYQADADPVEVEETAQRDCEPEGAQDQEAPDDRQLDKDDKPRIGRSRAKKG
ncbi:hypothetical protein ACH6CV_14485 [Bacillota bacterium Meth-B3]